MPNVDGHCNYLTSHILHPSVSRVPGYTGFDRNGMMWEMLFSMVDGRNQIVFMYLVLCTYCGPRQILLTKRKAEKLAPCNQRTAP